MKKNPWKSVVFASVVILSALFMGFTTRENIPGYRLAIQMLPGSNAWDCLLVQQPGGPGIGLCPDNPIIINHRKVTLVWSQQKYTHAFDESCQAFETIKLSDYLTGDKRYFIFKARLHVEKITSKHVQVMDCEVRK